MRKAYDYDDHPGHDAPDCPARITVTPAAYATSSRGYSCAASGGHCLPGERCDDRRAAHAEWLSRREAVGFGE